MTSIRPWGKLDWLMPKIGHRDWVALVCASFEPRCVAVPHWLSKSHKGSHYCLNITDPENRYSSVIRQKTSEHERTIKGLIGNNLTITHEELLAPPGQWNALAQQLCSASDRSVMLDITCMPKRAFLFIVKRLLESNAIQDLVVCYTKPQGYKEGQLTEDALPPSAIPGFSRIENSDKEPTTIVSVGYMAFNLGDLLEQQKGKTARFLFPFPPGSPGFRRSWRLLHELSRGVPIQTEIKRIHSMDMFAALDWLKSVAGSSSGNIDMIPLGPKPHTLAMGLAFPEMGDSAEISYSQPKIYHPEYSQGISRDEVGNAEIYAYCLRRSGINYI